MGNYRSAFSLRVLGIAAVMASAACAPTEPPAVGAPQAAALADASPSAPRSSAYVGLLRRSGIEMAIPSTGKFIVVNIPSYELVALQDGEPVLRSRVVVGKPATPTPELTASMAAIRFNPDWTPTPSMVRNEGLQYMPPGPQNPLGRMMFGLDNDDLIYLHDTNEKQLSRRSIVARRPPSSAGQNAARAFTIGRTMSQLATAIGPNKRLLERKVVPRRPA